VGSVAERLKDFKFQGVLLDAEETLLEKRGEKGNCKRERKTSEIDSMLSVLAHLERDWQARLSRGGRVDISVLRRKGKEEKGG